LNAPLGEQKTSIQTVGYSLFLDCEASQNSFVQNEKRIPEELSVSEILCGRGAQ
jgi:hypothetical protein